MSSKNPIVKPIPNKVSMKSILTDLSKEKIANALPISIKALELLEPDPRIGACPPMTNLHHQHPLWRVWTRWIHHLPNSKSPGKNNRARDDQHLRNRIFLETLFYSGVSFSCKCQRSAYVILHVSWCDSSPGP